MRKNNPAVYECKKSLGGLHRWIRVGTGAECVSCGVVLNEQDAAEVFEDVSKLTGRRLRARVRQSLNNAQENGNNPAAMEVGELIIDLQTYDADLEDHSAEELRQHVREWLDANGTGPMQAIND